MYLERFRLDGSVAFLTGAGRGIGRCTADALAEAGAHVILSGLDADELAAAVEALRRAGHRADFAALDVTDSAATDDAAARANAEHGPVDILVANAGIAWADTPAEDIDDAAWARVLDVNLGGVFRACRAFGRPMLERGRGAIVTVGSMSGFISNRPQSQAHYNASKAGVHHLTRSLAGEWAGRGVRVNAVAPTYVNTPMSSETAKDPSYFEPWMEATPMRRMIEPEEVAAAVLFLAAPASSAMTGAVVSVDAGYTVW